MRGARLLIVGATCGLIGSLLTAAASYRAPEGESSPWGDSRAAVAVAYAPPAYGGRQAPQPTAQRVADIVAATARRQGVDPALVLRLAYVESRFTRFVGKRLREGDRALGPLQVRPGSARALGFTGAASELMTPEVGAYWGVRHVANCSEAGARTDDELAACHVAGPRGWNRRLNAKAERYKHQYIALVRAAPIAPTAAGWLSRGEGSLNVASLFR